MVTEEGSDGKRSREVRGSQCDLRASDDSAAYSGDMACWDTISEL
jgi:hypothetical protein